MSYRLCYSCKWFVDEYKTPMERHPKYCKHPELSAFVGLETGGFISGTDIFHCDYFEQYPWQFGDVSYQTEKGGILAYVIPNDRKKRQQYILTDNSKNIKQLKEKSNGKKRNKSQCLGEDNQGNNSSSFGASWCPF